jgi:Tol biopolymer transport system component/chitodextrinase
MKTLTDGLTSPQPACVMKKFAFVLIGIVAALQQVASGQSQTSPIAYESCYWISYPDEGECAIRTTEGDIVNAVYPEWSPDGLRIAFVRYGISVLNLADGNVVDLTEGDNPKWSPDGARIAFRRQQRDGGAELYVINADGSYSTPLTHNEGFDGSPGGFAWSPDGVEIAFARVVASMYELYLVNADGSNPRRLTNNVGFGGELSWSPDGHRIAFDCWNDTYASLQICAINADGTNLTRLTADPSWNSTAVFSPVDGKMAFWTDRFGSAELVVMEADGRIVRVAPDIPTLWIVQHAWSPDGQSLAFLVAVPPPPYEPDGQPSYDIYVVNSDGTGLWLFASVGFGAHLDWFPSLPGQPVATFTYDCTGTTCQFDGATSFDPDGTIVGYEWHFGDGSGSSGPTATHTYATLGRYDVTLIVTDASGATDIARLNVSGNKPPIASFTVVCKGPSCTFDGSASSDDDGNITSSAWDFGDGTTAVGAIVSHAYAAVGAYGVRLFVTDNLGATAAGARNLVVVPLPMHVGDLDGASTSQSRLWTASVTITVHDSDHALLAGASVTGFWTDGTAGACTTNADGRCSVTKAGIPKTTASAGYSVTSVMRAVSIYTPTDNHDPDGDSSATAITIRKR